MKEVFSSSDVVMEEILNFSKSNMYGYSYKTLTKLNEEYTESIFRIRTRSGVNYKKSTSLDSQDPKAIKSNVDLLLPPADPDESMLYGLYQSYVISCIVKNIWNFVRTQPSGKPFPHLEEYQATVAKWGRIFVEEHLMMTLEKIIKDNITSCPKYKELLGLSMEFSTLRFNLSHLNYYEDFIRHLDDLYSMAAILDKIFFSHKGLSIIMQLKYCLYSFIFQKNILYIFLTGLILSQKLPLKMAEGLLRIAVDFPNEKFPIGDYKQLGFQFSTEVVEFNFKLVFDVIRNMANYVKSINGMKVKMINFLLKDDTPTKASLDEILNFIETDTKQMDVKKKITKSKKKTTIVKKVKIEMEDTRVEDSVVDEFKIHLNEVGENAKYHRKIKAVFTKDWLDRLNVEM